MVNRERLNQISEIVIGCSYTVSNTLGHGFLEKVFENSLAYEVRKSGLHVIQQRPIKVYYDQVEVGEYFADLLVEDSVIIEVKAVRALDDIHTAQCLNYLKATGLTLCLLINFGNPKVDVRRFVRNF